MADQTYTTIDITREQLDDAISLLERKSFISALRLASAADEILCKMLSHSSKQNYLDGKYRTVKPFRTRLHGMPLSKKDFIRDENRALIAVTRMVSNGSWCVTLDHEDAAYSMIVRALYNYDRLDLPRTARMLKFRKRFYEYVVGRAKEAMPARQALRDAAKRQTSQTAECCVIDGQECFVIDGHPRTLTVE
jgi:hypothetical protein